MHIDIEAMTPLEYFATLVSPPDDGEDIPLTEAALAIAQDVDPRLDLATVQSDIDRLAATLWLRAHRRTPVGCPSPRCNVAGDWAAWTAACRRG